MFDKFLKVWSSNIVVFMATVMVIPTALVAAVFAAGMFHMNSQVAQVVPGVTMDHSVDMQRRPFAPVELADGTTGVVAGKYAAGETVDVSVNAAGEIVNPEFPILAGLGTIPVGLIGVAASVLLVRSLERVVDRRFPEPVSQPVWMYSGGQ